MRQTLTLLILCFCTMMVHGQRRFGAAIEAGLTASQLDGDRAAGYSKPGLVAGIHGIVNLKTKTKATLGILFAQRGAQDELFQTEPTLFYSITLNYVEVPVLFHYSDWLVKGEEDSYYKMHFFGGLSYGRLISAKLKEDTGARVAPVIYPANPPAGKDNYLNDNDLSIVLGSTLYFRQKLGFSVRWMRSATFVYNPKKWATPPLSRGWNAHSLNFSLMYRFLK